MAIRPVRLERIERSEADPQSALLAKLMDTAFVIPGTKIRFGLDSIIDLVPGIGDVVGALVAIIIIGRASHLKVPKIVLARMAGNILINSIVGVIPFLGAVLTVFFRSNAKNYELLRRHIGGKQKSTARDWTFVIILLVTLIGLLTLMVWGALLLAKYLYHAIGGMF